MTACPTWYAGRWAGWGAAVDNVIDLDARRAKRHGGNGIEIPASRVPAMSVHFFPGPGDPLRVVGVPHDPDALRAAAAAVFNGAMALLCEAFRLDGDAGELPRLVATLNASGKIVVKSYNAPDGDETESSIQWMRGASPHLTDLIGRLTKETLLAARDRRRNPPPEPDDPA